MTEHTTIDSVRTVLIVEDDRLITDLIGMKLEEHHIDAKIATTGSDAIPKILEFDPDVIVLDMMLPEKSGEEILKELKANEALKNIPVIVFTNMNEQENAERMLALGAAEYLVKATTDLNILITKIQALATSQSSD